MNSADIFSLTKIVLKNLKREAEKKILFKSKPTRKIIAWPSKESFKLIKARDVFQGNYFES